jgi:hypothetical protein
VSVAGLLTAAEYAVREYCVYLSYDLEAARARGDVDAADALHNRWVAAGELWRELREAKPTAVTGEPWIVDEVRATAKHLLWQLNLLTDPAAFVRRREVSPRRRTRNTAPVPVGQPPYGWRAVAGGLIRDDREHPVLERMRIMRADGASYREIADALNRDNIPARRGRWHPLTVARIIARQDPLTSVAL